MEVRKSKTFNFLFYLTKDVSWQNKIYETISEEFGNKVFYTQNVTTLCNKYSKGTLYRAMHDLIKTGKVISLGRGTYKIK